MRKVLFLTILLTSAVLNGAVANGGDTARVARLNYKTLNFLGNIYDGTHNPVALSFNQVQTLADINFNTHFDRGAFHAADKTSRYNDFSLDISGLKQIGKVSLSGNIKYVNSKEYSKRWNSTYMLSADNPFTLGDSVSSNPTTEEFSLHAGAAYQFSDKFIGGLKLKYTTGSLSDQEDPRPKTNSMHFFITPGAWYKISETQSVGLSADIDIFRSNITHAIINGLENRIYFLQKGGGDYHYFGSGSVGGYTRDYKGLNLGINAQWNAQFSDFNNLLEVGFSTKTENAEDGGSSWTFKGGDFSSIALDLSDRLTFGTENLRHNIMLSAFYRANTGYWFDQKRMVDTEHANRVYYEVLSKDKAHDATYAGGALEYRIDGLQNSLPSWSAHIKGAIVNTDITQIETDIYHQKYTNASVLADGTKYWNIRKLRLETTLGAAYRFALGTPTFESVRDELLTTYVLPAFEYATASSAAVHARAALDIPVRMYKTPTWLTIYGEATGRFYTGDNEYSSRFDGKSQTVMDFGLRLTL